MVIFCPADFIAVNWGTVIARGSELMLNLHSTKVEATVPIRSGGPPLLVLL